MAVVPRRWAQQDRLRGIRTKTEAQVVPDQMLIAPGRRRHLPVPVDTMLAAVEVEAFNTARSQRLEVLAAEAQVVPVIMPG